MTSEVRNIDVMLWYFDAYDEVSETCVDHGDGDVPCPGDRAHRQAALSSLTPEERQMVLVLERRLDKKQTGKPNAS